MKPIKEESPTNSMGASSSIPGTGAIDTYNPLLLRRKITRNIMTVWKRAKDSHEHNTKQSQ